MGNLFGSKKKKETRITEQDRAVFQLKVQRDKSKQYAKKLDVALEKEKDMVRQLLRNGRKERAKLLLRKKKYQEGLIQKTENQLETIERMIHNIEFAQIEANVVQRLSEGNAALKKMHELLSIEDVERIMDDTAAGIEYQREIDELLSGGLTEENEEDVVAELEQLLQESEEQKKVEPNKEPEPPKVEKKEEEEEEEEIKLPDVPTGELEEKQREKKKREAAPAMLAS